MKIFILLSTILHVCLAVKDASVCTQPTQTGQYHAKPKIPDQFKVKVECNLLDKKQTTIITETYDFYNNRGAVTQFEGGKKFQGYFDYHSNEYLNVLPDTSKCTVQDLGDSSSKFLFGYSPGVPGQGHIFSASGALHFTSNGSKEVYVGKSVIRGIAVDTWYSCQYWPQMDATMNVTWYFTDKSNWESSLGVVSVPVSARVTGIVYSGTSSHTFDHEYNFYGFANGATQTDFEIPDGIVCPKRKNMKTLPPLSSSFTLMGEIVSLEVTYLEERYDVNQQIAAYRYKPSAELNTDYGSNRMVEINDFNTGVAYIMDELLGNCTVTQIDHGNFLYRHVTGSSRKVRMLTPQEFFLLDNMIDRYTYIGQRNIRGLMCDTWTGFHESAGFGGSVDGNITIEWYFLSKNLTTWNDVAAVFPGDGIPVAMQAWAPDTKGKNVPIYNFNVFDFDRSVPNVLTYDISPCYVSDNRRMFHFSVDGQFEQFISDNMELFKYSTMSTIVSMCDISSLRIANLKVDLDDDVHVTFEMLDVAPVVGDNTNVVPQVSLTDAANIFINSVQGGSFTIVWNDFLVGSGQAPSITVISSSLTEMDYEKHQFGKPGIIGFGPGTMAGVGFAMIIVGGTMGAGTSFFCYK
ncbi:uncharacterized protein LOC124113425 [Haliotis rufescens]|uniref:uncharacterized protein LOC124113425 n=1 Tax=Haliotis rufescens TaxID=6454 RepID=UPI00201F0BD1|nr:uncharacterized protein LOC124113425 [Haliotis rufescens]